MELNEEQKSEQGLLLPHINELLRRARTVLIALLVSFFFFFAFGIRLVKAGGLLMPVPYPSIYSSIADATIRMFIQNELPKGMALININPFDPLFASAYVSLLLSLFVVMPVLIWEAWEFVAPGLYRHEKRLAKYIVAPSLALFASGFAFAYLVIVPLIMKFVLLYTRALGVEPTISLRAFVGTVVSLTMVTGVAFEYPLVMSMLTYAGVVSAKAWRRGWRWGVLVAFIIAWIISPGTTGGVIETTIGLILSGLYFAGAAVTQIIERRGSAGS